MERAHLLQYPDAERAHLGQVLRTAGLSLELAKSVVEELESQPSQNLAFHARLELGIDPEGLTSPSLAALASFASFGLGALVPLFPWLLGGPYGQVWLTMGLSGLGLFGVGALAGRFTRVSWLLNGLRQLAIGALAGAATMVIGAWVAG